jgi:hypothetical protein
MTVKLTIQSLDEVPAAWRSEYVPRPDGSFDLDCIGGLKSALAAQRRFEKEITRLAVGNPELKAAIILARAKTVATFNQT